jgi:hypothetical protein
MRAPLAVAIFAAIMVGGSLVVVDQGVVGKATWYCGHGAACTRGTGPQSLVAAIDRKDTPYRKGDRVRVSHAGRHVDVLIVDVCACKGARVIDLTTGAFAELAPLSRGVINVQLRLLPPIELPATDTAP